MQTATQPWLLSPQVKYGLRPGPQPDAAIAGTSPLPNLATPSAADADAMRVWHPDSPLFWFGVLTLSTFGLMAVSGRGSIRIGPFRANAGAGLGKPDEKNE